MNNSDPAETLEQRLADGRLPVAEALRIAALLADQLRQLHDLGRSHGALTPAAIGLGNGVELLAPEAFPDDVHYTAPEVALGQPADARSDIFSFGAIFYEMLTGRRAFADGTPPGSVPATSGNPSFDALVAACVAHSPEARFQRVQKLQFEIKLLWTAVRRGLPEDLIDPLPGTCPAAAPVSLSDPALSGAMLELEARMTRRFQEQERAAANLERVASELLKALRAQPAQVTYPRPPARLFSDSFDGEHAGRVEKALEMLNDKIARIDLMLGTAVERVQKLEQTLEAWDVDAAALRDSVTRDIRNFERALKQHSTALESVRTAMGQTDDLVERVVEALDSLQSMFSTTAEDRALAAS